MQFEEFENKLAALLRSAGPETVAELTDTVVAWWNGERVVYAQAETFGAGALTGRFIFDACQWSAWKDWLADWLSDPVLSVRHDLPREP
ncbi:hypothetical protein PPGU19_099410 (plasmid) [Paraburkholderia sp. PGU19]|nr:hypothetical protein PPGU19_099410 [Paraburkholderia sp. PGU19]